MPIVFGIPLTQLAVGVFFVISGYLISGSWERRPQLPRYLTNRVLRIIPGLFLVVVVSAFVLGPLVTTLAAGDYFTDGGTYSYLRNAVLIPNYALPGVFAGNPFPGAVNGSLWTLPAEFACYLVVPVHRLAAEAASGAGLGRLRACLCRHHPVHTPRLLRGTSRIRLAHVGLLRRWRPRTTRNRSAVVAGRCRGGCCGRLACRRVGAPAVGALRGVDRLAVLPARVRRSIDPRPSARVAVSATCPTGFTCGRFRCSRPSSISSAFSRGRWMSRWSTVVSAAFAYGSWHLVERPSMRLTQRFPWSRDAAPQPGARSAATPSDAMIADEQPGDVA